MKMTLIPPLTLWLLIITVDFKKRIKNWLSNIIQYKLFFYERMWQFHMIYISIMFKFLSSSKPTITIKLYLLHVTWYKHRLKISNVIHYSISVKFLNMLCWWSPVYLIDRTKCLQIGPLIESKNIDYSV